MTHCFYRICSEDSAYICREAGESVTLTASRTDTDSYVRALQLQTLTSSVVVAPWPFSIGCSHSSAGDSTSQETSQASSTLYKSNEGINECFIKVSYITAVLTASGKHMLWKSNAISLIPRYLIGRSSQFKQCVIAAAIFVHSVYLSLWRKRSF